MSFTLRINLVLVALLLVSSFWLIRSSNEARTLFVALGRAQVQEKTFTVEHDRLQAERRTAATPLVVEELVRKRLGMFNVKPDVTHYVQDTGEGARTSAVRGAPVAAGGAP
jgi:cell division protein FtsL